MDALDVSSLNPNMGAMGAAFGRNRDQKALERAEAKELGLAAASGNNEDVKAKAREVAEDFVSVFMNQVMKSMRNTVQENPQFHGDNGEKFFQEMLDTEQSKTLAKGSGYGLTDLIYQSLMASASVRQADAMQQEAAPVAAQANEGTGKVPDNDLVVNAIE